jgi:transcriptional regulator with PAS, ATPase and Fis domain
MSHFKLLASNSPAFDSLIKKAKMVAVTDATILIEGETGTGKEVLAVALQKESKRHSKPFITVNCGALPESIVESELFGHLKGSFTGATANKKGIFQATDGGTVFLDEINSLPLSIQAKLLRFLEAGECYPVGATRPDTVNVRIISATNADLNKKVAEGSFRQDLFFRLNIFPLEIPALRDRKEDIEMFAEQFISYFSKQYVLAAAKFSTQAIRKFCAYNWPGNIRELRNLCERLAIMFPGKTIMLGDLPYEIRTVDSDIKIMPYQLPESGFSLMALEADLIHQALAKSNGNLSKSARMLGLSRYTLVYRIQKHNIKYRLPPEETQGSDCSAPNIKDLSLCT